MLWQWSEGLQNSVVIQLAACQTDISFFLTLDIEQLRSIRFEDPDNRVSDPTDLAINPDVNRFITTIVIVLKCWRAVI